MLDGALVRICQTCYYRVAGLSGCEEAYMGLSGGEVLLSQSVIVRGRGGPLFPEIHAVVFWWILRWRELSHD